MADEYANERVYIVADVLESGELLFKTEYGSLITETTLKDQLLNQLRLVRAHVGMPAKQQLRIRMEVVGVEKDEAKGEILPDL